MELEEDVLLTVTCPLLHFFHENHGKEVAVSSPILQPGQVGRVLGIEVPLQEELPHLVSFVEVEEEVEVVAG